MTYSQKPEPAQKSNDDFITDLDVTPDEVDIESSDAWLAARIDNMLDGLDD